MNKLLFNLYFIRFPFKTIDDFYFRLINRLILEYYNRILRLQLNTNALLFSSTIAENYIVSLTTYKDRIKWVHLSILSILLGSIRPKKIVLYLSEDEFPRGWDELPKELILLQNFGLDIEFRSKNLKSHKKYCYSFKEYSDFKIITIDDDILYPYSLLKKFELIDNFIGADSVISFLGMGMDRDKNLHLLPYESWSYVLKDEENKNNLPIGSHGILYNNTKKLMTYYNENDVMNLFETGDDIYLFYLARKANLSNYIFANKYQRFFPVIPWVQKTNLYEDNIGGGRNDIMLKKMEELLA